MQYHVAKNGEKSGPFDKEEVYRRLVAGDLSGTDLGWHEGLADWKTLAELLPPPSAASLPVGGSGAGYQGSSGLALSSLICGIISLPTLGLTSIPAVITGHMALSRIRKSLGALEGKGLAIGGLVTGYLGLGLFLLIVLAMMAVPIFGSMQHKASQAKAMNNARQLVLGMKQYASDHDGSLPPSLEALYDEKILEDRRLLEYPISKTSPDHGQGWEYCGAGMKDASDGKVIVLISRKADRTHQKVAAHLDGTVEILKE